MTSMIGILNKVTSGFLVLSVTDFNIYKIDCIFIYIATLGVQFHNCFGGSILINHYGCPGN